MKNIKIVLLFAFFFFSFCLSYGQSTTLGEVSPDGRYQLFLNEKDIDNNSGYFESYVVDLQKGDKIILAKNYKVDGLTPNWFWDAKSKYLIFEGREYGSIAKLQVWDLENRFLLYELRGSIPVERTEVADFWDSEKEVLTFYNFENIENPKPLILDLKTRKVREVVKVLGSSLVMIRKD